MHDHRIRLFEIQWQQLKNRINEIGQSVKINTFKFDQLEWVKGACVNMKLFMITCLASMLLSTAAHSHGNEHGSATTLDTHHNNTGPVIHLYREASCGCCTKWGNSMLKRGYQVVDHVTDDMQALKKSEGIPSDMSSCHTAFVGGYFVEGHVPVESIDRLLDEMPNIAGLTVPGMPLGSPGMEAPMVKGDSYSVIAVSDQGNTAVYDSYVGSTLIK